MENSIITLKLVKNIIGKRNSEIHKGDCGRILIAAGSEGMAGAAILSATGALRAGCGLVKIAIPKDLFSIAQIGIPEATCIERNFSKIDLKPYNAMAIGPGIGLSEESEMAIKFAISNFDGPLVLDADALNIIAAKNLFDMLRQRKIGTTVITPHVGEAERLLGKKIDDRRKAAMQLCIKTGAITLLKGHDTIVATYDEKTYINTTGNPGMATAGSGDVLTGIIAGLIGQKKPCGERLSAEEATICGAFVHGMAGDLAAETVGEYGLIAGDIAYYTAKALMNISR